MFNYSIISHRDITNQDLKEIIRLKSAAWPFPEERQNEWMKKNLTDLDYHFFLSQKGHNLAYLNLISTDVFINEINIPIMGIGNVCAIETGKGYGRILLKKLNEYLKSKNLPGLLFCKPNLIPFYEKHGWKIIPSSKVKNNERILNVNCMIFNLPTRIDNFRYSNKLF